MRKYLSVLLFILLTAPVFSQVTLFEKSNGLESATYFQAIDFYKQLDKSSSKVLLKTMGQTDAGYPLHLLMVSGNGSFDPAAWHKQKKAVILVINSIHPGEPDGIDATMMLI